MLKGYRICGVCISHLHEDVLREFLEALSMALAPHGWRVMVFATSSDMFWKTPQDAGQATVFDLIDQVHTDALVILRDKILDERYVEKIAQYGHSHNIPVFGVNGTEPLENCCCIQFDYEAGFAEVVRHLIEHHHITRFHYISGMKDNEFALAREKVMRRVLAEYGMELGENDISYGDFWANPARQAAKRLIDGHRLPQAIVCANDTMAIAVAVELSVNGLRVPQDVIVTGFDGIDAIRYSIPKITSAKCDYTALGQKISDLILAHAEGEPLPPHVSLIPSLLLSESCGCIPRHTIDVVDFINGLNDTFNRFRNEDERLNTLSSDIQASNTPAEVSEVLHHGLFYCMSCMVKQEVLNPACDPAKIHSATTFGEKLYVLCDSDWHENEGSLLPAAEIAPRMEDLLAPGTPVVLLALHHLDIPLGYVCYHYQNADLSNYLKMTQIAMILSSAISGYRSKHYQLHLQAVVEEMYKYDALTGLMNRSAFLMQYRQLVSASPELPLTLVLCDLDGLKYINDHFSHTEGDNAISVAASALHEVCRGGLCCRYGGDEMIALLTDTPDAGVIRKDILGQLSAYNRHSGKEYEVSASIGVYTAQNEDFEQMFQKADALMYADKQGKRHRRD